MASCNCCETTCDHGPLACNGLALVDEGYCDSCTSEIFGYVLATYRTKSTGLS